MQLCLACYFLSAHGSAGHWGLSKIGSNEPLVELTASASILFCYSRVTCRVSKAEWDFWNHSGLFCFAMSLEDSSGLRTLGSLQLWSAAFLLEKQASLWLAGLWSFKHFTGIKRVSNIIAILPTCVWDCVCVVVVVYVCVCTLGGGLRLMSGVFSWLPFPLFFFQNEFPWTHSSSIQFRLNELQARIAGLQSVPRVLRILEI